MKYGLSNLKEDDILDIPGAFKFFREKKGLTQGDVCRATGYERAYISRFESGGVKHPRLLTIYRLCTEALGVTVEAFINKARELAETKKKSKKSGSI